MTSIKRIADLPIPPADGLMGHLKTFKSPQMHKQLLDWSDEFNGLYRIRLANRKVVMVGQRPLLQHLLKSRPTTFRRFSAMGKVFDGIGINGIFSAEGENWQRQRAVFNPAFNGANLRYFFPTMNRVTGNLVKKVMTQSGAAIEIKTLYTEYALDMISNLAFAYDINTLGMENTELHEHLSAIFPGVNARISSPLPFWKIIKSEKDKKLETGVDAVITILNTCIAKTRKKMGENPALNEQPENLLQAMLAEVARNKEQFSDDILLANAITIMLAGEDTTANTLSWLSHLLSIHPDIQHALREEIDPLTEDELQQWPLPRTPLLTACIHESMRVKSVAPVLYFEALEDTLLGELPIPKGQSVVLLLQAMSQEAEHFPEPSKFNPYRWLTDDNKAKVVDMAPFGGGPRVCPGRSLALLEMKIAMMRLIKQFEFEAVDSRQVQEKFEFVVVPDNLRLRLKARVPAKISA